MTGRAAMSCAKPTSSRSRRSKSRARSVPNEVLVQTECTFISAGTELANFTGLDPGVHVPGSWNQFPARPGYANCGRVIELGSER